MTLLGFQIPVGATEVVHFNSAVMPQSLSQSGQEQAGDDEIEQGFPLWGHLSTPEGSGPFPAVVLMHGCNGIQSSHADWASLLTELGYVTLILDSFRPRSFFNLCDTPIWSASPTMRALDAYGALGYLQGLQIVDSTRIGVVGWSHGGIAALAAVNKSGVAHRFQQHFKTAVAFYPYCISDRIFDLPVLVLIGEADDWTPVDPCREMQARSANGSDPIELVTYPGVHHGFDDPILQSGFTFEGTGGRTHWLKYDVDAHHDAIEKVEAFLAEHL